jgi:hypothetical protein
VTLITSASLKTIHCTFTVAVAMLFAMFGSQLLVVSIASQSGGGNPPPETSDLAQGVSQFRTAP